MNSNENNITYEQYQHNVADEYYAKLKDILEADGDIKVDTASLETIKNCCFLIAEKCFKKGFEQGTIKQAETDNANLSHKHMELLEKNVMFQEQTKKRQDKSEEQTEYMIKAINSLTEAITLLVKDRKGE